LAHELALECDGDCPGIGGFFPDRARFGVESAEVAYEFSPPGEYSAREVSSWFRQVCAVDVLLIKLSFLESYSNHQEFPI
jgi:hypothetical protein